MSTVTEEKIQCTKNNCLNLILFTAQVQHPDYAGRRVVGDSGHVRVRHLPRHHAAPVRGQPGREQGRFQRGPVYSQEGC